MMCDFSCSLQFSWIPPCKGYKLGIIGPETTKSPLCVTEIHAQSTLISSSPPLSCHMYPQNQIPMLLLQWAVSGSLVVNRSFVRQGD